MRISLATGIIIALIVTFVLLNTQISDKNLKTFRAVTDKNLYAYQIEELDTDSENLILKGWFFELMKARNEENEMDKGKKIGIVLYNLGSGKEIDKEDSETVYSGLFMNLQYTTRNDVNEYFKCEYDYSKCGFIATISLNSVDLQNGFYQIIFKPEKEGATGLAIDSTLYIDKGKLSYIDPRKAIEIDATGTELEEVVKKGICVASNSEKHICVYQYGWTLYWIADEGYNFEEDGSTVIQYQIDTTQFDRLPENRRNNGYYWADNWATFERHEKTYGKYRVLSMDIPLDYSVTRITTGYIAEGRWIWKSYIRPIYNFNK